jgi:hypothetical protein
MPYADPEQQRRANREYRARRAAKGLKKPDTWRKQNQDRVNASKRSRRAKNLPTAKAKEFADNLKYKFNLTPETFHALLEQQAGLCRMCCEPMVPGRHTHVDHNHTTLAVRGLLCSACNHALGHLREDLLLCDAAKEYLINQPKGPFHVSPRRSAF